VNRIVRLDSEWRRRFEALQNKFAEDDDVLSICATRNAVWDLTLRSFRKCRYGAAHLAFRRKAKAFRYEVEMLAGSVLLWQVMTNRRASPQAPDLKKLAEIARDARVRTFTLQKWQVRARIVLGDHVGELALAESIDEVRVVLEEVRTSAPPVVETNMEVVGIAQRKRTRRRRNEPALDHLEMKQSEFVRDERTGNYGRRAYNAADDAAIDDQEKKAG
jgi:hypothetical protein